MPRIGFSVDDQSMGGSQFDFAPGRGRVIGAVVANHAIPNVATFCGFKLLIQRLDENWRPTADEPQEEFLEAGFTQTFNGDPGFHPGNAKSSDDQSPDLEIGMAGDMGDQDGAEGTCLLTGTGYGPMRAEAKNPAKLSIFGDSLVYHGVDKKLLNGYAPNLLGLEAMFTRLMMKKSKNDKDVTCLIVGKDGKVAGGEIHKYPTAQGGGAVSGAVSTGKAVATAAASARTKPNGAVAPARPAPVEAVGGSEVNEEVSLKTGELLRLMFPAGASEQTITRARLANKLAPMLAKHRVPVALHKPIQEALKNDAWFSEFASDQEWVVSGGNITIPAVSA
jgi:hypothetical protein